MLLTIKHFQTKGGRYTTAIVYPTEHRTIYDFDKTKIQLALAVADPNAVDALCKHFGVLTKGSLLTVKSDWEIDI